MNKYIRYEFEIEGNTLRAEAGLEFEDSDPAVRISMGSDEENDEGGLVTLDELGEIIKELEKLLKALRGE